MLIRPLFDKYQKNLVAFANTKIGRLYLGATEDLPIWKVTPDALHYFVGFQDKKCTIPQCKAVFYSRSPYLKKFDLALTSLEIASESFDFLKTFDKPDIVMAHFLGLDTTRSLPMIMLATGTFYPDANAEVTSVDGWTSRYNASGESWATLRGGAGTSASDSGAKYGYGPFIEAHGTSNLYVEIDKHIYLFDTSSLGGGIVTAATFSVYGDPTNGFPAGSSLGTAAQKALSTVASNPASNTALIAADHTTLGTTKFATDFAMASYNASGYNDIALNATGIAAISVTGITKLGHRMAADNDNSQPTWGAGYNSGYGVTFSDNGSNKPKLVVTYTPAPSGGFPIMFGGGLAIG